MTQYDIIHIRRDKVEKSNAKMHVEPNGDVIIEVPVAPIKDLQLVGDVLEAANFTDAQIDEVYTTIHDIARVSWLRKIIR